MKWLSKIFTVIHSIFLKLAFVLALMAFVSAVGCGSSPGGRTNNGSNDTSTCTDLDHDGYFAEQGCGKAVDCNDRDASIYPGAPEQCVKIDNNCDGLVDNGCAEEVCGDNVDNDGDGVTDEECSQGSSFITDTGQARCYDNIGILYPCPSPGQDYFGQDACYSFVSSSFTKLDDQGGTLPDDASSWSLVKDNFTGLTWEVKRDDYSLLDKDNIFTWDYAAGTYIAQLNTSKYCGFSDWRLPTIDELTSLVDFNTSDPATNSKYFPNTMIDYYWSSSVSGADSNIAKVLDYYEGALSGEAKQTRCYVRAVRGEQLSLAFLDHGDGTITAVYKDKSLMWMQATAPETMTWQDALTYCENLTLAGYSDWRLPNIKELRTLVDHSREKPTIDLNFFPDTGGVYWSSTTVARHTGEAWIVGFDGGSSRGGNDKTYVYGMSLVRAVRGGQ